MATTLEELEMRVVQIERELARLRHRVESLPHEETPAERGARLLREAKASQAAIGAAVAKAYAEIGITGEPVGPETLREMMAACGVKAEENVFTREIIAMRDE
jgi:hypothetical protein